MPDLIYVGNYRPQVGGASISCHQLLSGMAERGCNVRVLASITTEAREETLSFDAANPQLGFHRFPVPFYFNRPYEPAPDDWNDATRQGVQQGLRSMIAERRPDALLLREGWIEFAAPVAEEHGIAMVTLVRGNPTAAILAGSFPEEAAQTFLGHLRRTDWLVAVAGHFLPGLRGLGFTNVTAIPNGVDLQDFAPRPRDPALAADLNIPPDAVVALQAGHIKDIKRPLDVVRSATNALAAQPRLRYMILGEGDGLDEVREAVAAAGLNDRFLFHSYVPYDRMPDYMNLVDIVLVPSEREGLARVYLEAQACGKTLIASDIPAAKEVVADGETGLLFPMGDAAALAQQTIRAAGDPALRERIGRQAREAVQKHDIERAVDRYLAVLADVLAPSALQR